jgi:predicted transcriptional regulator
MFDKRCIHADVRTDSPSTEFEPASNPAMTRSESHSEGERLEQLAQLLDEESESELPFTTAVVDIFDIKCPEMEIYLTLLEHPESTPYELGDVLDRSRSGIGKRLRSLDEKGLVSRKKRIDDETGARYEYTAKPLDETVDWMAKEIDEWSADLSDQLTTFREEWPETGQQETESV